MQDRDLRLLDAVLERAGTFGHREHLEVAWRLLEDHPLATAKRAMADLIRHVATEHGVPGKYHETLTMAWVHLVAVHRERWPAPTFEEFIANNQDLMDRRILEGHYSRDRLWGAASRAAWSEPDLSPLPALA